MKKEFIMSRLFEAYRGFHRQAFAPIFCQDDFDSKRQVEACVQAGCVGIEYTLRKPDAREMIPWIRRQYPDLFLLVGSVIDDERIIRQMRRKHPQLMTLAEIADLDVDGFISMIGWTEESIAQYAPTHLVAPTAMTVREALLQTAAGAHFQKLSGSDLGFVKRCRGAAAFGYCPIVVTGGQTLETMDASFEAGAVMVGSGFDLTLRGCSSDSSVKEIEKVTRTYLESAQAARAAAWPELAKADDAPKEEWLDALPHFHPFD